MDKRLFSRIISLAVAASLGVANAGVILTFTPSTLNTVAGGTVEFVGTLTNTGTADVYLNGDVVILPYPDLTVDDSPFFISAPLFLSGGSSYTGPFIDVMADLAAVSGSYGGSYTIQGGVDANTFGNLATQDFSVNVSSSVPEVNSFLLAAVGLLVIVVIRRLWDGVRFHGADC